MTAIDLVLIAPVLAALAALGVEDARRAIVDPRLVLALAGAGLLWRLFGSAQPGSLAGAFAGAGIGVGVVAAPILAAHLLRRPWPLFPGDAMLLAGVGFVLGPLGLGWSLLAGAGLSLLYRAWLQRRRGRSFRKGYCPLGPGIAAGAMAVFVLMNAGAALAADGTAPPVPPQPRPEAPHDTPSGGGSSADAGTGAAWGPVMLAATELAPLRVPLPSSLAAMEVAVHEPVPIPFAAAADRLATLAGIPVEVEERPGRVAGGAVSLPDPPDMRLSFEGPLTELLNLVAARSGYDWMYRGVPPYRGDALHRGDPPRDGGVIVFYRYRDVEQRAPEAALETPIEPSVRTGDGGARAANRGGPPYRSGPPYRGVTPWIVDPARHGALLDVLEDWAAGAGWSVVWKSGRRFAIRAGATFGGTFLDAVDLLLAAPATRRSLVAFAHESNRHLVIHDRGSPWSAGAVR